MEFVFFFFSKAGIENFLKISNSILILLNNREDRTKLNFNN